MSYSRMEVSLDRGEHVGGIGRRGCGPEQRVVYLYVGDTEIAIFAYGEEGARSLMKSLAGAAGGLLATLPDDHLEERDETAVLGGER